MFLEKQLKYFIWRNVGFCLNDEAGCWGLQVEGEGSVEARKEGSRDSIKK